MKISHNDLGLSPKRTFFENLQVTLDVWLLHKKSTGVTGLPKQYTNDHLRHDGLQRQLHDHRFAERLLQPLNVALWVLLEVYWSGLDLARGQHCLLNSWVG